MGHFYNTLVSEKSKLQKRMRAVELALEAFSTEVSDNGKRKETATSVSPTKKFKSMRNHTKASKEACRKRREWIRAYFANGDVKATGSTIHELLEKQGLHSTYIALDRMLRKMPEIQQDKESRLWSNKAPF